MATLAKDCTAGDELSDVGELLELLDRRPAWHADAACREHPEINFFPGKGDDVRPAREICAGCLVRAECAAWAFEAGPDLDGMWAGLSAKQRRQLLRSRRS